MEIYLGQLQPGLKDCHYNGQLRKLFHKLAHKVRLLLGSHLHFNDAFLFVILVMKTLNVKGNVIFGARLK